MSVRTIGGLAFCLVVACEAWSALTYDVVWTAPGDGGFSAANVVRDSRTGKTQSIVASQGAVGVVCLDPKGKRLWEHRMTPLVTAAPAVADVDGDGHEEVIAADSAGELVVLRSDGAPLWTARLPGGVAADSCPAVADLAGDGAMEILVGGAAGTLSCFDRRGTLLWQFSGDGSQIGPLLIADIYDTPGKEVVFGCQDHHVYVLTAQGRWLWDIHFPNDIFPNSTPILADVDGDHVPELYVGGGLNHFYRIDLSQQRVALDENVDLHVNSSISAADLDGAGKDAVVFGNKTGGLWRYGAEGFKWKKEFRKSGFYAAPLFMNLDDDPALEAILHSVAGDVQILKADGTLLLAATTPCPSNATPLIGDFDDDGMAELIATQPGWNLGKGMVAFVKLGVPYRGDQRLPEGFAGNRARTGRAPGAKDYPLLPAPVAGLHPDGKAEVLPVGEQRILTGLNTWRYDVANPEQQRLALSVSLAFPDGGSRQFVRHVTGPTKRVAIAFDAGASGGYSAERTLLRADSRAVYGSEKKRFDFKALENDEDYLETVVFAAIEQDIAAWRSSNVRCGSHASTELATLRGQLAQVAKENEAERIRLLAVLRTRAERLQKIVGAAKVLAPSGSFFAWEFTPWAYFDERDTLPTVEDRMTSLAASLCIGEYKSLAVNITNVSEQTVDVRVLCDTGKGQETASLADHIRFRRKGQETASLADHIRFRRAVTVPTDRRERVSDALPLLDQASGISIPALESRQLWITMDAEGLRPGRYEASLRIKSLEVNPTEVVLPMTLVVHDLALPRPRPLRFCLWTSEGGELGTGKDYVLKDLIEHGATVFMAPSPTAECNAQGELTGEPDFMAHDKAVARLARHGVLLYISPQDSLRGQPVFSDAWRKGFVAYMRAWSAHMKKLGVDYSGWAVYPYDEPSTPYNETTLNLVEVAKLVREADPAIRIYADPTSGTTMQTVAMLKDLVDIWCPSSELLERLGPELTPTLHGMGKEIWFYDALGGAKTLSCLGNYRWWFWYAWTQGFTGAGWWCYGSHHGESRWDGPEKTEGFFSTVYEAPGAVVSSKRWEASREGVQDYEYLYLLRQAIVDAEGRGVSKDALAEAKAMLGGVPVKFEALLRKVDYRLPLTPDSVPLYRQVSRDLDEARRGIVEMCLRVRALQ